MITPMPNSVRSRGPKALRSWNRILGVPDGLLYGFRSHYPHVPPLSGPVHNPYTHDTGHSTSLSFLVLYRATCTEPRAVWLYYV